MDAALLHRSLKSVVPDVSTAPVADLEPMFSSIDLVRGAPLLTQGDRWRWALLIERGLVRMHFVRRDGREFNKNFFAEGALVCPITCFTLCPAPGSNTNCHPKHTFIERASD